MSIAEKLTTIAENEQKVYDAGKKEERKAFWEEFTNNGEKGVYYYSFCSNRWTQANFKPMCDLVPTEADHMFYKHNYYDAAYDLAQHLENLGVILDFSNCTVGNYTFESAVISRLPEINNAKGTFTCFVRNCAKLKTIDKIICSNAGDQNFTQTFNGCTNLKNILFEGVIGRSISFSASPLTLESVENIITCLKDYYGTENEYTYTLTLSDKSKELLETADTDWVQYIEDIGWNLA